MRERRNLPWGSASDAVPMCAAAAVACFALSCAVLLPRLVLPPAIIAWPSVGASVGLLLALGPRAQAPVAAGTALGTFAAQLVAQTSIAASGALALCDAVEALVVAHLVWRLDTEGRRLEDLRSALVFLFAAVTGAAAMALPAALIDRLLLFSGGNPQLDPLSILQSHVIGIAGTAPLLTKLPAAVKDMPGSGTIVEGTAALTLLAAAILSALMIEPAQSLWLTLAPPAMMLPLLLWLAVRTPPVFPAAALLIVTASVTAIASAGTGRFGDASFTLADRVAAAQTAIATAILCSLALSATIASQRNAGLALIRSEEKLRQALAAAGTYAFEIDLVRGTAMRVGGLLDRLDLAREGKATDLIAAMHPDDRPAFLKAQGALSPEAPSMISRVRLKTRDGSYLHIGHRAEATFDACGNAVAIVGTCTDVSERVRQAEALQASDARLKEALRMGQVFAYEWDAATGEAQRSENAAAILGLTPGELNINRNELLKRIPAEDQARLARDIAALSIDNPVNNTRYRYQRPDGRMVWLEVLEGGAFDAAGKLLKVRGLTRDVTEIKRFEERQEWLIGELDHRVKNTLSRMSAMIQRSRHGQQSLSEYVNALAGRIDAMSRTHERLRASNWSGVGLASLLEDELAPYKTDRNTTVSGPPVLLTPDAAQALAVTLHELATNAAKYGALSRDSGRVAVSWALTGELPQGRLLRLTWVEETDWTIETSTPESYGTRTIRNMLGFELDAEVQLDFTPHGVRCVIEIPASQALPDLQPLAPGGPHGNESGQDGRASADTTASGDAGLHKDA